MKMLMSCLMGISILQSRVRKFMEGKRMGNSIPGFFCGACLHYGISKVFILKKISSTGMEELCWVKCEGTSKSSVFTVLVCCDACRSVA